MKKLTSYLLIISLAFTMTFSGTSLAFAEESTNTIDTGRTVSEDGAYVEDEILVVFEDKVSEKKAENIVEGADVEMENMEKVVVSETSDTPEETPYVVTLEEDQTSVEDAVEELEQESDVTYVQPNYLYTTEEDISAPANDPYRKDQWNFDYMNIEEAWDYIENRNNTNEDPIKVATLDTRILEREDLELNINRDNCVDATQEFYPQYENAHPAPSSHGTSVAGTLAADANNGIGTAGVASGRNNNIVQLMGINVFRNADNYQSQASATTADIVSGLNYAISHDAKVINMALGHTRNQKNGGGNHDDEILEDAINEASKQAILIATAGNDNTQSEWLPSDFENVISVINTIEYKDAWSKDCKAKGSNYGPKKDISAPGSNIWHPKGSNGYESSSGTSLAAPQVSGVAAMVLYVNPDLNPNQVRDILLGTTTDLYTEGYDIYTGYGNVDAYAAVKAAGDYMDNMATIPNPDRNRDSEMRTELATPSGLKATNSEMEEITVKWNKVPNASRYSIYRSENGASGTYKNLATITSGSTTSYTDTAATYKKTYHYKIRAYGTSSETHKKIRSEDSVAVSATSSIPNTLSTPTVKASGSNYKSIKISWKKVSGAHQYRVWRATSKNGEFKRIKTITSKNTLSYTDSTCTFGQAYFYKVFARGIRNGKEIRSSGSTPVSATPVLPAPNFKITSVDYKTNKVSWNKVSGANGYRIYRSTSKTGTYSKIKTTTKSTTTSWLDTGLKPGKGYYYKIRPYRKVNGTRRYGTLSAPDKHYAKPAKPTFTLKKSGRRVTLTLKKNSKLTGYTIYRKTGANGKWKRVKTVRVNKRKGATYSRALTRGKTYYFKVKAFKKSSGKRVYSVYSSTKKRKI